MAVVHFKLAPSSWKANSQSLRKKRKQGIINNGKKEDASIYCARRDSLMLKMRRRQYFLSIF